jgi:hypothetical protein
MRSFDELYGYAPTRAEWERERRERKQRGLLVASEYGTPWHCKWQVRRNGGIDQWGEWVPSGSWTCQKIIKPSYNLQTAVQLIVTVQGRATRWKSCRPARWSASLALGGQKHSLWHRKYGRSCKSVSEACRKAERLPFLDVEMVELLRAVYGAEGSEALHREVRPGEYEPFLTVLWNDNDLDFEGGKYLGTRWYPAQSGLELRGRYYHRFGGGSSTLYWGADGPEADKYNALMQKVGCWVPAPEEKVNAQSA